MNLSKLLFRIKAGVRRRLDNRQPITSSAIEARNRTNVRKLYELILRRAPDEAGLASHAEQLTRGDAGLVDVVGGFLASAEYAENFTTQPNVARSLVETLIVSLTGRHPGDDAVHAYTQSLVSGVRLTSFLDELKGSPEFVAPRPAPAAGAMGSVPVELAVLAQDLIAAQMVAEGNALALPPIRTHGVPAASPLELASLIRTLAMLGASPTARPAAEPAARLAAA